MQKLDRTKLTKTLGNNNILVPFLERAIEKFDEPWSFKYTGKHSDDAWHPSGDCTPSVTSLYTQATTDAPDSKPSSLRKSFMVGHFWHQWIQHIVVTKLEFATPEAIECIGRNVWKVAGEDKHGKLIPAPYHWATGQGDIAPLITPRWHGIVDIKTIGGEQFKTCVATRQLPERFAFKYLCQINIYMDFFDENEALILGVNKDSPHDFIEFKFQRDQKLIDAIYRKWKFVSDCLDKGNAPTEDDNKEFGLHENK